MRLPAPLGLLLRSLRRGHRDRLVAELTRRGVDVKPGASVLDLEVALRVAEAVEDVRVGHDEALAEAGRLADRRVADLRKAHDRDRDEWARRHNEMREMRDQVVDLAESLKDQLAEVAGRAAVAEAERLLREATGGDG